MAEIGDEIHDSGEWRRVIDVMTDKNGRWLLVWERGKAVWVLDGDKDEHERREARPI